MNKTVHKLFHYFFTSLKIVWDLYQPTMLKLNCIYN